jgi:hypothetical protein
LLLLPSQIELAHGFAGMRSAFSWGIAIEPGSRFLAEDLVLSRKLHIHFAPPLFFVAFGWPLTF